MLGNFKEIEDIHICNQTAIFKKNLINNIFPIIIGKHNIFQLTAGSWKGSIVPICLIYLISSPEKREMFSSVFASKFLARKTEKRPLASRFYQTFVVFLPVNLEGSMLRVCRNQRNIQCLLESCCFILLYELTSMQIVTLCFESSCRRTKEQLGRWASQEVHLTDNQ